MTDRYTLIESGDSDDAENVASMFGHPALVDYVHPDEQFEITNIDTTNDAIDISSGKAYLSHSGTFDDGTPLQTATGDDRRQAMFTVEHPGATGLPLTVVQNTRVTNYIWLDAQVGTGGPQFVINTSNTPPREAALKIATIDVEETTGDNSADILYNPVYYNRGPHLVADEITSGTGSEISLDGSSLEDVDSVNASTPTGISLSDNTIENVDSISGSSPSEITIDANAIENVDSINANTGGIISIDQNTLSNVSLIDPASSGEISVDGSDLTEVGSISATNSGTISVNGSELTDIDTVDATTVRVDGNDLQSEVSDTRESVNELFIQNARQDFELGLSVLDMNEGQFEIYATDSKIINQENVVLDLGSPVNGKGTVTLADSETTGFTEHEQQDYDVLPESVVVTDDVDTVPENGTIEYEIEDENGNVVTVTRDQLNSDVDVTQTLDTFAVTTRAVLKRDTIIDTKPVLDAYSVYVSGSKPDTYLDVTSVSVEGR